MVFDKGIHKTAVIHATAELGQDVSVGPYSVIGAGVIIGDGTCLGPHVTICGNTTIGCNNKIFQYCSIGDIPQDKKYKGEHTQLQIGDGNVIREFCSIHTGGTLLADGTQSHTQIGDKNWFLNYTHIAHDCQVGSEIVFVNNATLAGHVIVEDHAIVGASTKIHQSCRIGEYSFSRNAVITKDLAPYVLVTGDPVKSYGLNKTGLKRANFSPELINVLHVCYMKLLRKEDTDGMDKKALEEYRKQYPEVEKLVKFIEGSQRGVIR